MNDLPSSPAAAALFELLGSLAGLRNNPEAIKNLTPGDQEWLDESLKDYRINAINLAEKFVEPLRKNAPAHAEDIYDIIRRLTYTSTVIGATLVFSDSTKNFLKEGLIAEKVATTAANARLGKDKTPEKIALKNAIYKYQVKDSKLSIYTQASQMRTGINQELRKGGFDSVNVRKIERMLKKIILSD